MAIRMNISSFPARLMVAILLFGILSGCAREKTASSEAVQVIATTTILADVASEVGGKTADVHALLPVGADPHGYELTSDDLRRLTRADLLLINGLGLEQNLSGTMKSAGMDLPLVVTSRSIKTRTMKLDDGHGHASSERHVDHAHNHGKSDPHVWFNPNNVLHWVDVIETELVRHDSSHADIYRRNAEVYRDSLRALDRWIRATVSQIPEERRVIVSDHKLFGYFADEYGFKVVGSVVPGFSSLASPSARAVAKLETTIAEAGVRAILVGQTVNPVLAERIAEDTGAEVVRVYTGSLSSPEEPAATYLDYMRYNVRAITRAAQ
ncbi:zinc ABC transporter substrate-binding protein [bacterium]|nr:zinc ABC transporter substrate-binding protein [bacterium]